MRPVLFSIGSYSVLAGPVFAGLAALLAYYYIRCHREYARLSWEDLWTLMAYLTAGTFIGSVAAYMGLFGGGPARNLDYVLRYRTIQGGTFYGNLWGCFLAAAVFARLHKKSLPALADLLGGASLLALFLLRWGCLQHGCCHGRIAGSAWAITFHYSNFGVRNALVGLPLHPTQIYSSAASLLIFLGVHFFVLRRIRRGELPPGSAFAAATILYSVFRFFLEFIRGSDPGLLRPFGWTTSQFLAVLSAAAALYLLRTWRARQDEKE